MKGKDTGNAGVLFCLIENNLKKIIKKVFYFKISITFDLSKALKQSNKPYQNEKFSTIIARRIVSITK